MVLLEVCILFSLVAILVMLRARECNDIGQHRVSSREKAKDPPVFEGKASVFREWVFAIELAMKALAITQPGAMVDFAAGYLGGNARLWFMASRDAGEIFDSWPSLRQGLEKVFGPLHEAEDARMQLFSVAQRGRCLDEYVGEFTRQSLRVPELDEHSRALLFARGLDDKLRVLALREHPTTLASAIRSARSARYTAVQDGPFLRTIGKRFNPLSEDDRQRLQREGRCFSCRRVGHLSRDCPNKHPNGDRQ